MPRCSSDPPAAPLLLLTGHTHEQDLDDLGEIVVVNGGTVGGGGAGNFHEDQPFGLAVVTYERTPSFRPLAADMVTINPRDGSAERRAHAAGPALSRLRPGRRA